MPDDCRRKLPAVFDRHFGAFEREFVVFVATVSGSPGPWLR